MKKLTPEDPESHSSNLVQENIAKLKALFPQLLTEAKDGAAVNVDVLKQLVGDATVTDADEKYGLTWNGKRKARLEALKPSTGTLRPAKADSVEWDNTQHLLIEGDNLEVLKLLQKSYAHQVKLIYIDPPYNTGKDFVYPDDYQDNLRNYKERMGTLGKQANPETSGRFHTDWLNSLLPRLMLALNLLSSGGIIMISIDDHEIDNLRLLCDEVFGEENFIAQLFWEKGRKNDAKLFSIGHDYILVYAKSKAFLTENGVRWREAKPGAAEIQQEYLRLRELYGAEHLLVEGALKEFYATLPKSHPSKKLTRYSHVDARGVWRDDNLSWPGGGGPAFDLIHPVTGLPCKVPEGGWRYAKLEKLLERIELGYVEFRADHTEPPIRKTYLVRSVDSENDDDESDAEEEGDVGIQVAGTYFYRSALQASNLMLELFGTKVFDSPKDVDVLSRWIRYVGSESKDDLIVDFYAGSGTTGHAVLAQNAADGGNRRYILVQLPEPLDPAKKEQKTAADFCDKLGVPRTIAELTKERLRRAAKKVKAENPDFKGDLGFRVFKLDSSNLKAWDPHTANLPQSLLDATEHVKPDRSTDDLLYELLLKKGLDLAVPMEHKTISGKEVVAIGGGVMLVCLADAIDAKAAEPLAMGLAAWHKQLAPANDKETVVIFKDSAFDSNVAKSNMTAILEQRGLKKVNSI
jgi:adenine-specific DNA-methyltransferase